MWWCDVIHMCAHTTSQNAGLKKLEVCMEVDMFTNYSVWFDFCLAHLPSILRFPEFSAKSDRSQ